MANNDILPDLSKFWFSNVGGLRLYVQYRIEDAIKTITAIMSNVAASTT